LCGVCGRELTVGQGKLSSRAAVAGATAASVGSIAWYTHLYGQLPFIGEMSANSPAENGLHPAAYPWSHKGWLDTFDHAR
jgi:ubiquinol-cytochrome c reductase cytochrome c1 subunit